jgi:hypothetical protein
VGGGREGRRGSPSQDTFPSHHSSSGGKLGPCECDISSSKVPAQAGAGKASFLLGPSSRESGGLSGPQGWAEVSNAEAEGPAEALGIGCRHLRVRVWV